MIVISILYYGFTCVVCMTNTAGNGFSLVHVQYVPHFCFSLGSSLVKLFLALIVFFQILWTHTTKKNHKYIFFFNIRLTFDFKVVWAVMQ